MTTSLTVRSLVALGTVTPLLATMAPAAAQTEGGLYIAEGKFTFQQAAEQGLARNPRGQRFFVLALPPNAQALTRSASKQAAALRDRVTAAGGVLLVCKRDIDSKAIDGAKLAPGVVAVRGFPPPGSNALPPDERYFPGEDTGTLPQSNEALRRLRAACS